MMHLEVSTREAELILVTLSQLISNYDEEEEHCHESGNEQAIADFQTVDELYYLVERIAAELDMEQM